MRNPLRCRPLPVRLWRCARLFVLKSNRWSRDHWWNLWFVCIATRLNAASSFRLPPAASALPSQEPLGMVSPRISPVLLGSSALAHRSRFPSDDRDGEGL
jgi:hypothetical protein